MNAIKGEVAFSVEGRDYTLVLNANALCEFEAVTGEGAFAVLGQGALNVTNLRAFMWAGLRRYHKGLSIEDVGDLLSDLGPQRADELMGQALTLAWPKAEDTPAADPQPQPAKKPAKAKATPGTGSGSTDAG